MDPKKSTDPVETSEVPDWAYRITHRHAASPDGDGGRIAGPYAEHDFRRVLEVSILANQDRDLSTFRMFASDGSVFGVTVTREET
jgi:hypothetical protein